MMKVTREDLKSIRMAMFVMAEVQQQTLDEKQRAKLHRHIKNIRKIHGMLLAHVVQPNLPLQELISGGISDDSKIGRGILATISSG
jgi:hypothetical protein